MNILIVKLSAIGDVIHTLPSLAALRRCYPDAEITWVVEEAAADILANHPDLNRVIVSGRKRWLREIGQGRILAPLREILAFFRELRRRRYDIVIDFHGLLKSAVIVLLSGGKRKIGYDSLQEMSGLFYNEKIPEDMRKHAVDRYLDLVFHLATGEQGPDAPCMKAPPEFRIAVGETERRRVAEMLAEQTHLLPPATSKRNSSPPQAPSLFHSEDKPEEETTVGKVAEHDDTPRFIAINPVAFWETKLWDDKKFAVLCDLIRRELGIGIVLTGSEAGPLDRIRSRMSTEAVNLGGRTTLRELACLYRRALLLVTTDSGPMHLAAAVGTPVVALFGPTDPARTGPYGPGHTVIRSKSMDCMPCFRKRCDTPNCMMKIEVGEIFAAIKERLSDMTMPP